MKENIKKWLKQLNKKDVITYVIIAIFLILIIKFLFGGLFGYSLVVIENGPRSSMWPTYDKGDLFLIYHADPDDIHLGDVIVYESATPISRGTLIIHRVVNITIIETNEGTQYYYRVSGDNPYTNNYVDPYNSSTTLIPYNAIKGKTIFMIPYIGYIRLWLAENQAVRIILIIVLFALGLYLVFSPEKEKNAKEKKEKEEVKEEEKDNTKEEAEKTLEDETQTKGQFDARKLLVNIKVALVRWLKKQYKKIFGVKKNRITFFVILGLIVFSIIAIPLIDNLISDKSLTTGITDIDRLEVTENPFGDTSIVFVSFIIHFQDDGTWNKVFKEFTVYGIQNDTIISEMRWYSHYQKEGKLEIGGSLVIPVSLFNASLPLTIQINYTIHLRFGHDYSDSYSETFNPPF